MQRHFGEDDLDILDGKNWTLRNRLHAGHFKNKLVFVDFKVWRWCAGLQDLSGRLKSRRSHCADGVLAVMERYADMPLPAGFSHLRTL